jgi:hypothetical protein
MQSVILSGSGIEITEPVLPLLHAHGRCERVDGEGRKSITLAFFHLFGLKSTNFPLPSEADCAFHQLILNNRVKKVVKSKYKPSKFQELDRRCEEIGDKPH